MMVHLALYLVCVIFNVLWLVSSAQILPNRLKPWTIAAVSLVLGLMAPVRNTLEVTSTNRMVLTAIGVVAMVALQLALFQGKIWKRLIVILYIMVLQCLCDLTSATLLTKTSGNENLMVPAIDIYMVVAGALSLTLFAIVGSASVTIWRMLEIQKFQPFYLLFFILPIGQFLILYHMYFLTSVLMGVFGALLSLVADVILLVYTLSHEKKTVLEKELREMRHMMELEQAHYEEVERRRDELAKIRHDFNNQLASIGQLIRSGEDASAQEMISAVADAIDQTNESPYCGIPVVNAILNEKHQDCVAAGSTLEVELDIPRQLLVEPSHLCSVFGNLLDNAVQACRQLPKDAKPVIRLTTMVDGDYLFIKTVNISDKPPEKPAPGRGYGSRILAELAERYCGSYHTEYRDGEFSAVVSLLTERTPA